jgi:hypothetical protein
VRLAACRVQTLPSSPTNPSYQYLETVAIDGPQLIVIGINDAPTEGAGNTYAALLYRRKPERWQMGFPANAG